MARSLAGPPGISKWGVGMEIAIVLRNCTGPAAPVQLRIRGFRDPESGSRPGDPSGDRFSGGRNALEPHSRRLPIDNIAAVNVNTFPWRVKLFAAGESNSSSREFSSLALLGSPAANCAAPKSIYLFVSATHTIQIVLHYCLVRRQCFMTLFLAHNDHTSSHAHNFFFCTLK